VVATGPVAPLEQCYQVPTSLKNFFKVAALGGLVTNETRIIDTVERKTIVATGMTLRNV